MVRPTDQEAIAVGKIVFYSQFPRGGVMSYHTDGTEMDQEAEEARGTVGKSLHSSL